MINANWFVQDGKNYFKNEGGDKLLALYLNLQRFIRYDQFSFREDMFYFTSINQIYKSINEYGRVADVDSIFMLLKKLEELSIVKIVSHPNFETRFKSNLSNKELLIIQDLDYMRSRFYMHVPLDVIKHMLDNKLTYKHVALFLLMNKWTNNNEEKCFVSVNKLADWIGYSNKTILKYYGDMNRLGVMASHKRRDKDGHTFYEHYLLRDMDTYDEFKSVHKTAMNKYK
ncbi:hypothetical protein [Oceanobacillus sp. FSL H7-0719]|uniref:hypothetical protein n=1 Tax=Oceanobacillus sp. FSL H7-0719 TaxID=2954507 RepID=UPI0032561C66